MDPLTLKALADLGIAGYRTFQNIGNIRQDRREELDAAAQAKQAGQETYADLTEGNQFRVRQAPTKAADLTLNLAEQGLDRTRDRSSEALAGATANLGVDPRTGIAGVQRLLGQLGQMEGAAEQRAATQSIGAQKLIDDSIYNQREAERRRLEGLKTQFELMPAMQEYTRATGAAEALENAEREAGNQFISDALASTTNLIAGLDRNKSTSGNKSKTDPAAEFRAYEQRQNDLRLQNQLAQPIPIVDDEYDAEMARRRSAPVTIDDSGVEPVSVDAGLDYFEEGLLEPPIYNEGIPMPQGPVAGAGPERGIVDLRAQMQPVQEIFQTTDPLNIDLYNQSAGNPYITGELGADSMPNLGLVGPPVPSNYFAPSSQYEGSGVLPRLRDAIGILPDGLFREVPSGFGTPVPNQPMGNPLGFEQGGSYIAERGGMTEGEFDHDTNKKAIVDQETGRKEGEMTGGEGVFSKDQLAEIVEMIREGDEDGLLTYLQNLLEEPQFGYEFA